MIRWKDSVRFDKLHGAMGLAAYRVNAIYEDMCGVVDCCWITSANDSIHMQGSKHYEGKALDFRTNNLPSTIQRDVLLTRVRSALGPQFTVLLEDPGKPNEHLHVQFNGE